MSNDKNTSNVDLRNTNWLQSMADCVGSVVIIKDRDSKYVLVNKFFADLTGFSKKAIIGKNDIDLGIPAELVLGDDQSSGLWKLGDAPLGLIMSDDATCQAGKDQGKFIQDILDMDPALICANDSDATDQRSTLQHLHKDREQLTRRNAFHSSLSSLAGEKETRKEYIPLLQRISEEIIALLGADSSYISVVHESKDYIQAVAAAGNSPTPIGFKHLPNKGIAGTAWKEGAIQVVDEWRSYCRNRYCISVG